MGQGVDYAALARQHGGAPKYDFDDSGMTPVVADAYKRLLAKRPDLPPLRAIRVNPNLEQHKLDGQYVGDGVIEVNPRVTDPVQLEALLLHELEHAGGGNEQAAQRAERPNFATLAAQFGGKAEASEPTFRSANEKDATGSAMVRSDLDSAVAQVNASQRQRLEQGSGLLPTVGAMMGSVFGIPGAIVGGIAGEAGRQAALRGEGLPGAPSTPAAQAVEIGKSGAVSGVGQAGGQMIGAGMRTAAPWLMQSALKPAKSLLDEYKTSAPKIVQTLLKEGVNVTEGGVAKLQRLLNATNKEIKEAIANATGTIDKKVVSARTLTTADKFAKQVNPQKDLEAIGETVKDFLDHPVYTGSKLTVPEAQALKVGTYREIGKKYGEVSSASIETQKALARGLKEEIAEEVGGIGKLNLRDSELMAALDATGRRVAQAGNRDPVGFAWVTQNPTTFLAALFDRSPVVKSLVARGLFGMAGEVSGVSAQLIRAAAAQLASGESAASPPPP